MNRLLQGHFTQIIAFLLAFLLLAASMTACKKEPDKTPDDTTVTEALTDPTLPSGGVSNVDFEKLHYSESLTKPKIRANYAGNSEQALIPMILSGENGKPRVTVSASWTSNAITLYVACETADRVAVSMGNFSAEYAPTANETLMIVVTAEQIGIRFADLGQEIPLTLVISAGNSQKTFDGCILLNDYEIFQYADCSDYSSVFNKAKLSVYGQTTAVSNSDTGAKAKNGSILIFDNYSSVGNNCAHLRSMVQTNAISKLGFANKSIMAEFDLTFESMPVTASGYLDVDNAYGFFAVLNGTADMGSVMVGFINTSDGICVYMNAANADSCVTVYTGKKVGETFHAGIVRNGSALEILIDNVTVASFENAAFERSSDFKSNTLSFVWQRNGTVPTSAADNFAVSIDNLTLSYLNEYTLLGTVSAKNLLGTDPKLVDGNNVYLADRNLTLPNTVESSKYNLSADVIWQSSNTQVISSQGTLKNPETAGEFVTLRAYLICDNTIISEKDFAFFVKATNPTTSVLRLKVDTDPVTGSGSAVDAPFVADGIYNSIIYDMGSVAKINRAVLNSLNETTRVTQNFVSLYSSNDNKTYTAITDFSLVHSGNETCFYNFTVEARYLKIHFTYPTDPASELGIFNSLQKQLTAYYSEEPLLSGGGTFAKSTSVSVKNGSDKEILNKMVSYTLAELGISVSDLKADMSDIRFRCGDYEVPHYYVDGIFYLRIPRIAANTTATVEVLYGNPNAVSVSDGLDTFEVQLGTTVVSSRLGVTSWRNSVALMPDGSLVKIGTYGTHTDGKDYIGMERSEDGGRTWTSTKRIAASAGIDSGGGFIVDYQNGIVFYFADQNISTYTNRQIRILKSEDSGRTWTLLPSIEGVGNGTVIVSYSDGIKLSCYDGAGPNVDYVFTAAIKREDAGDTFSFVATAIYSTDAGKTWKLSDSRINYGSGSLTFEGGVGEETVYEQKDGTLLLYARCQIAGVVHFAVSHSKDHGITWEENATLSNVYTSNTQPIIVGNDGTPVLLWGGNNTMGGTSYCRFPLNIAYSNDDGETFTGILDISHQTITMSRIEVRNDNELYHITNPDIVLFERGGVDCAYILTTNYCFLLENFSQYLYQTKGAFDSFESGSITEEGWVVVNDSDSLSAMAPSVLTTGATDGKYAMHIGSYSKLSRSIPQVTTGSVTFDLYVESMGGFTFELQSAYNADAGISAPITLYADANGKLSYLNQKGNAVATDLILKKGANTVTVDFDGNTESANLTVNGKHAQIAFRAELGSYACFVYFYMQNGSSVSLDRFTVIDFD